MSREKIPDRDLAISSFVAERRRIAGLTQYELGDLAGVGHRFIVELEAGKRTLRLDKVNDVLEVFGARLRPVSVALRNGMSK